MEEAEPTIAMLQRLRDLGIHLALDDFSTSYSSLGYLKRYSVDTLKLDRTFIHGLGHNAEDTAIVRAVLAFAQALSLTVTAEGIETDEQLEHLLDLGCERGQGYYFARPMPGDAIGDLLATSLGSSTQTGWLGRQGAA